MVGTKVPGMLHLHEEELQNLVGYVLTKRDEIKPVLWSPGCMTTLMVVKVGVGRKQAQAHSAWSITGNNPYSSGLRMDMSGLHSCSMAVPPSIPSPQLTFLDHGGNGASECSCVLPRS